MENPQNVVNPPVTNQGQPVGQDPNVAQVQAVQPAQDVPTPSVTSRGGKKGLIVFIILLFVAMGSAGAYLLIKKQRATQDQTSEDSSEDNQVSPPGEVEVEITALSEANNYFGFNILRQLADEDAGQNIFISPVSMEMALLMTYNGAEGETKDEMADVLGVSDLDLKQVNEESQGLMQLLTKSSDDVTVSIANSLWGREGITFKQEFIDNTTDYYDANVESVDFSESETVDLINVWIEDNTNDKIQDMISELDSSVVLLLVNAIYFKGTWETEFDKELTEEQSFTKGDGEGVTVDMMHQESDTYMYFEDDDIQLLELPYTDDETVMYVLLPKEGKTLEELVEELDSDVWEEWVEGLESKEGTVELPKFKMEYGTKSVKQSLINLGMKLAFSAADFSGMSEEALDWIIDDVLHKSFIDVNEEGTEAAAATVVIMKETAIQDDLTFSFIADHPFLYAIADKDSGAILFVGIMQEPVYN